MKKTANETEKTKRTVKKTKEEKAVSVPAKKTAAKKNSEALDVTDLLNTIVKKMF